MTLTLLLFLKAKGKYELIQPHSRNNKKVTILEWECGGGQQNSTNARGKDSQMLLTPGSRTPACCRQNGCFWREG